MGLGSIRLRGGFRSYKVLRGRGGGGLGLKYTFSAWCCGIAAWCFGFEVYGLSVTIGCKAPTHTHTHIYFHRDRSRHLKLPAAMPSAGRGLLHGTEGLWIRRPSTPFRVEGI